MAVLSNTGIRAGASAVDSGYKVEKSLRFEEADSSKLKKTFAQAGDQGKFTLSFWFKNCDAGASKSKMLFCLDNSGSSQLELYDGYITTQFYDTTGSGWYVSSNTSTTHRFRDPSAWYHIVLSIDTNAGTTNADRHKIYINGEQLTLTFSTAWSGLMTGKVKGWNTADEHFIGMRGSSYGGNWLAAEYYFIDGQALDPSSFGETDDNGKWVPKKYEGTYGPKIDQSETWSDGTTTGTWEHAITRLFNGNLAEGAQADNSGDATLAFSGITAQSSIEVYGYNTTVGTSEWTITAGGSDYTVALPASSAAAWTKVTGLSFPVSLDKISNVEYRGNASGIRVDGVELVDSGVTFRNNNGFYLKFNGTDIGEDSSGNDNDWAVVNLVADNGMGAPSLTSGGPFYYNDIATMFDGNASTWAGFYEETSAVFDLGGSYSGEFVVKYSCASSTEGSGTETHVTFTPGDHTITVPTGTGAMQTSTFTGSNVTTMTFSNPNGYATGFLLYDLTVDGTAIVWQDKATVDQTTDSPTDFDDGGNGTGNYATINPLGGYGNHTLTKGNLEITTGTSSYEVSRSTIATPLSGKWYAEMKVTVNGTSTHELGLISSESVFKNGETLSSINLPNGSNAAVYYYSSNGTTKTCGTSGFTGATWGLDDVIGIAYNADDQEIKFYKNGVLQGTNSNVPRHPYVFAVSEYGYGANKYVWNFGQRAFEYTPPSGHKALNTNNLPEPSIKDPSISMLQRGMETEFLKQLQD